MKSFVLTAYLISFIFNGLFAQTDFLAVIKAKWKKEKITAEVKLKTFQFDKSLFKSKFEYPGNKTKEKYDF